MGKTRTIDRSLTNDDDLQEWDFDLQAGSTDTTGKFFGWFVKGDTPPGVPRGTVDYDDGIGTTLELVPSDR